MRDIKFRAWDGEFMWSHSNLEELHVQELCLGVAVDCPCEGEQTKLIVMQFTGLLDKNGVEWWESDIIGIIDPEDTGRGVIVFKEGAWRIQYANWDNDYCPPMIDRFHLDNFEAIGDIYTTPELLK